jgi:ApaG protein
MQKDVEKKSIDNSNLGSRYAASIKVSVEVMPAEKDSDIDNSQYVFSYTVTIENHGSMSCQLINRHWKVFSDNLQIADIKGEGVVGQQPVLRPLDSFEYSSWTVITDPSGYMLGMYTFHSEDGVFFDVQIPRFELQYRNRANVH